MKTKPLPSLIPRGARPIPSTVLVPSIGGSRLAVAFPLLLRPTLKEEAAIVLRFRAFDIKFHPARGLMEFFKDLLELLG